MRNLEDNLKKYYSEIRKLLVCDKKLKSKFIKDLSDNINLYIQENENSTMDDIEMKFGIPEELAESFFYPMDKSDTKEYSQKFKVLRNISIVCVIMILIAIIGLYIFNYIYVNNSTVTINYDTIIESEK